MHNLFDIIEKRLKSLIEGNLDRFLNADEYSHLSQTLSSLIHTNLQQDEQGRMIAPDIIQIVVSPERLGAWQANQDILNKMAQEFYKSGLELGYIFQANPCILLTSAASNMINNFEVQVAFTHPPEPLTQTSAYTTTPEGYSEEHIPKNAFIIVNGQTTYNLDKNLVNIGRRSTCDIQINDPQVSRDHVQLRALHGRYMLFDLGSIGGTYLNSQPCRSATLNPGDVIRMGSTHLIYSQDMTGILPATSKFEAGEA